jgi:hypothetical protein
MNSRNADDNSASDWLLPCTVDPTLIRACLRMIPLWTDKRFVAVRHSSEPAIVILHTRDVLLTARSQDVYSQLSAALEAISTAEKTWLLFDMKTGTCRFASFSDARFVIDHSDEDK